MRAEKEIDYIKTQFLSIYFPQKLFLFGSQANEKASITSDIDICVVMNTQDKRMLLTDMYMSIQSDKPFDLLLYTPDEWERCLEDKTSFAYKINKEGVRLYG
jgi:predicted nucleotidyltransferase